MRIARNTARGEHRWARPDRPVRRSPIALVMIMATSATGLAEAELSTAPDIIFQGAPVLALEELKTLRGGFEYAGMKFDFGANLRTFVDGKLALETVIQYTENGVLSQHHLPTSPANTPGRTTPQPSAAVPGSLATSPDPSTAGSTSNGAGESVHVVGAGQGSAPTQVYMPNVDITALKDATGVLINDRKGAVLALHEATRDRITSLVVNQATGRDIRQEVDLSVTIQNFRQFQDTLRGAILSGRLGAAQR